MCLSELTRFLARIWPKLWAATCRTRASVMVIGRARFWLTGVDLGRFEIFEILGGAGDIYKSTSMPNYYPPCLL